MSAAADLTPDQVRHVVAARLGRDPQDMLEAAVVLEAWSGLRAGEALRSGQAVMQAADATAQESVGAVPDEPEDERQGAQALTLLVTVVAIAWWAAPLTRALRPGVAADALVLALPASVAAQWALQARYLSRPDGLGLLAARWRVLVLVLAAGLGLGTLVLGTAGLVGTALAAIWTGGLVLVRRGWALLYGAAVCLGTAGMLAELPALAMVAGVAGTVAAGVAFALVRAEAGLPRHPAQPARVLVAGAIGAGLGILLVGDRSLDWATDAGPALALLPSTAASLWAGRHLWRFQRTIPVSLAGVPVSRAASRRLALRSLRVLGGALGRLAIVTAALSGVLLGVAWLGGPDADAGVLAGFGLVAVATLLVGVLEAVGRGRWALAAVACGVGAEVGERFGHPLGIQAGGLIAGAAAVLLVALPAVMALLATPARTLATVLYVR
jgi:Co/Zn/Cd efflux system component